MSSIGVKLVGAMVVLAILTDVTAVTAMVRHPEPVPRSVSLTAYFASLVVLCIVLLMFSSKRDK